MSESRLDYWHRQTLRDRSAKILADWREDREFTDKKIRAFGAYNELLSESIEELKKSLNEIIGTMKNNHSYHGDDNSWKCNDEDCVGCLYERRYLKGKEDE